MKDNDKNNILNSNCNKLQQALKAILEAAPDNEQAAFDKVAELLINHHLLIAGDAQYEIKELEFYYLSETHEDPYVHKNERQGKFGSWYFHRLKSFEDYKHTRRGLDLTFGNKEKKIYGGILIRAIKPIDGNEYTQGPSKVVGKLLEHLDTSKMQYHLENPNELPDNGAFNSETSLHIIESKPLNIKIFTGNRFGLEDKNNTFQNKHYRYFAKDFLQKIKGKEKIFRQLADQGKIQLSEAKAIIGYNINKEQI